MTGADEQDVAALDLHRLAGGRGLQIGHGDRVPGLERPHAVVTRDVQEDTASDDLVRRLVMLFRAARYS
jgi:hypothetical protein